MSPKVFNNAVSLTPVAEINALQGYMTNKRTADFADVRANVPPLAGHTDAELAQVVKDAGFIVEEA